MLVTFRKAVSKVLIPFGSSNRFFLPSKILRTYFAETDVCPLIPKGADFFHELIWLLPAAIALIKPLLQTHDWDAVREFMVVIFRAAL